VSVRVARRCGGTPAIAKSITPVVHEPAAAAN
jgi:hypothetical protein